MFSFLKKIKRQVHKLDEFSWYNIARGYHKYSLTQTSNALTLHRIFPRIFLRSEKFNSLTLSHRQNVLNQQMCRTSIIVWHVHESFGTRWKWSEKKKTSTEVWNSNHNCHTDFVTIFNFKQINGCLHNYDSFHWTIFFFCAIFNSTYDDICREDRETKICCRLNQLYRRPN